VNKEELVAMMVAIEAYLKRDHAADWKEWQKRVERIATEVRKVKGVTPEPFMPEIHYRVPHLRFRWDETVVKIKPAEAIRRLREGTPSIEVRPNTSEGLEIGVWMLAPGQDKIVAQRIREVLHAAL
jgi:L-seryl-tRNA(Ser) seleniumtransferase